MADAAREQNTPISVLNGVLDGDTSTRYLRPTLYDLLIQRAFEFYLTDEPALTKPKMPFSLNDPAFFSDSRAFRRAAGENNGYQLYLVPGHQIIAAGHGLSP